MGADTTDPSYWLNWRFLVSALYVFGTLISAFYLIWKYEGKGKLGDERRDGRQVPVGVVYKDELWKTCLEGIHPFWLLLYRILAFGVLLAFIIGNTIVDGPGIFYYYTQLTFVLTTVYFGLASAFSLYGFCYEYYGDSWVKTTSLNIDTEHGSNVAAKIGGGQETPLLKNWSNRGQVHVRQVAGFMGYLFQSLYQSSDADPNSDTPASTTTLRTTLKTPTRSWPPSLPPEFISMPILPPSLTVRVLQRKKREGGDVRELWVLVAGGAVLLTDVVYWLLLYPVKSAGQSKVAIFDICAHSINILILGDAVLNGMMAVSIHGLITSIFAPMVFGCRSDARSMLRLLCSYCKIEALVAFEIIFGLLPGFEMINNATLLINLTSSGQSYGAGNFSGEGKNTHLVNLELGVKNVSFHGQELRNISSKFNLSLNSIFEEKGYNGKYEECDIFDGKWVKDDSLPHYSPGSCPLIDTDFNCYLNGRPDQGFYTWRWQPNLCNISRESTFQGQNGSFPTLRLDLMDETTKMYHDADILIFNTGHWWTHEKTSRGLDYYQEGNHLYPRLKALQAYGKALRTWGRWVDRHVNPNKTLVFFRGYSGTHFRGGQWNSGGQCHKETEPIFNETYLSQYPSKMRVLEQVMGKMKTSVMYLNISRLTDYRKDAHPSIYRKSYETPKEIMEAETSQDCSHWCLPGLPDIWNELLYASLLQVGWTPSNATGMKQIQ
ncbi:hypothetical protein KSS87_000257 [Heliosperma pusillum]|nr:hypothetical protein KSS87_000257 [Heliosperma pusillum]